MNASYSFLLRHLLTEDIAIERRHRPEFFAYSVTADFGKVVTNESTSDRVQTVVKRLGGLTTD